MVTWRWLVLASAVTTSCARDLCEDVDCRQQVPSVCVSDTEVKSSPTVGVCVPSTGACTFRPPLTQACSEGSRCMDGACRCVPSLCAGCCVPNGSCVSGAQLNEQVCGVGGAECARCAPSAICAAATGCVTCPAEHVVRQNRCVDDDVAFDVSLAGATRWPAPPFDGGITLWHLGPAAEVTVKVVARSAAARVNESAGPQLQLPVSLARGSATLHVEITAPSGRAVRHQVTVFATRAISGTDRGTACFVTRDGQVDCDGARSDAGTFVGVGGPCGFTATGEVWCRSAASWERRFAAVPDVIDISLPCVRTRSQSIVCEGDGGLVSLPSDLTWRALECRSGACCALDEQGSASCWGSHAYNLFDFLLPNPYSAAPIRVPGLPHRYERLTSGTKTFFGQTEAGEWSSAVSYRMGLPGPAPFVVPDATGTTLKLESPYYCIMGLERDGGLWTIQYAYATPVWTPVDAGGIAFIDFAPVTESSQRIKLLTSEHQAIDFTCP